MNHRRKDAAGQFSYEKTSGSTTLLNATFYMKDYYVHLYVHFLFYLPIRLLPQDPLSSSSASGSYLRFNSLLIRYLQHRLYPSLFISDFCRHKS
jgi:hypothetical protein